MADNSPTMATSDLRLRPMRPDEYPTWVAASKAAYAKDIAEHGGGTVEVAQAKADADFAAILPDGLETPGHAILVAEVNGEQVGRLWIAERENFGQRFLYIYEITIDKAERGKGYGRATMLLAETEARARGLDRLQLNVFGGNDVARGLYRSLGYIE